MSALDFSKLATDIKNWGMDCGFQQVAITDIDLKDYEPYLQSWIQNNYHGAMDYMAENHSKRCHPEQLHAGTTRVICVRMESNK